MINSIFFLFQSRHEGAVLLDHLEIANINVILNSTVSGEAIALVAEFKLALNAYLKELVASPVRSLAEVIAFNEKFSDIVSPYMNMSLTTIYGSHGSNLCLDNTR